MSNKLTENTSIPALADWMTLPEAAKVLGFSRQYAYKKASDGYFESLHRIGDSTFVVSTAEVRTKRVIREERRNRA